MLQQSTPAGHQEFVSAWSPDWTDDTESYQDDPTQSDIRTLVDIWQGKITVDVRIQTPVRPPPTSQLLFEGQMTRAAVKHQH